MSRSCNGLEGMDGFIHNARLDYSVSMFIYLKTSIPGRPDLPAKILTLYVNWSVSNAAVSLLQQVHDFRQ